MLPWVEPLAVKVILETIMLVLGLIWLPLIIVVPAWAPGMMSARINVANAAFMLFILNAKIDK